MQYDDVITNPRWRTDAILKIVLWLYLGAILADQREIWIGNEQSHADIGHMTKTAIFENSKWRTATILKIALSPYLSCKNYPIWSNLVCTFRFPFRGWTFWQKFEILQIQDGGRTPYWKSFLAISQRHIDRLMWNLDRKWRITYRYRSHMTKTAFFENSRWRTAAILKIALSPYLSCKLSDFWSNLVCTCRFPFRGGILTKNLKFC